MYFGRLLLLLSFAVLAACQSTGGAIGVSVTKCCAEPGYHTFSSETADMPAFLVPLIKANFDAAFSARGLVLNAEDADLMVVLRYEQENLAAPETPDDFEGHIAPGGNVRYIARIQVEIHDASSGRLVWAGNVQRIHDVDAGEYMHSGKASLAIFNAFTRLLSDFSVPAETY